MKWSCPDRPGLVADLTRLIAENGGNLLEMQQFTDTLANWFFTHMVWECQDRNCGLADFRGHFARFAGETDAVWHLRPRERKSRVAIMVSKEMHCLADLLYRVESGELPLEIAGILSNHKAAERIAEQEGLPFYHIPVDRENKRRHFDEVGARLDELEPDLVVLARYMQIIPPDLCERWAGRMMNIHHSFLPAFAGASPYKRAFERGVKLIGATCHYVTEDLDEGPIITQEIVPVEHYHTPEALLRLGRDCERLALARGVRYHVKDRVLIHGRKTVVFRD